MTDTLALMGAGFVHAIAPVNLLAMLLSTIVGITIGCLPGLSAAMGVALLLPVTFGMDPATGLIVLGGIYCGAIFGGSISAILIHTPGTPASAATAIEGVAGSEAANNAVTGGSLIPTLTLGIPGESVTAVLMGGLIIHGLQPGPELFTTYAGMTYTFFAGFVLVQFFMLGVGALGCRGFAHITRLSDAILIPSIFLLCVVGSYAIHNNVVEVVIMLIFGVIGYLARKFDLNAAAIVLGLILGPIGERGLRRSLLISDGDPSILFSTPLCWVLIALCVVGVLSPLLMERMERRMREGMEN